MRTDGRTEMTKLTGAFRNFAKVPKTHLKQSHVLLFSLKLWGFAVYKKHSKYWNTPTED
jgi:hypothetical protein